MLKKVVWIWLAAGICSCFSDTFIENYQGGGVYQTNVTVETGSHTFEVDTPALITKNTEWYVTYSGGSPVETDSSAVSNPQYTQVFSSPGTYWVRAEIYDSGWNWEEVHRWEVTVEEPDLPDLIVEDIWTVPSSVEAGESYVIWARIRNQGDAVAEVLLGSQNADFFIDGVPVDFDLYDNVAPGAAVDVKTGTLTAPSAGGYSIRVEADADEEVDEEIEGNNYRTESMTVESSGPPDLIVQDIWTDPSTVYVGQSYTLKARIKNQGGTSASVSGGSQDADFYVNGSPVGTDLYDNLDPMDTVIVQVSALTATTSGTYSVRVEADADDEVDEGSYEGNNDRTDSVVVSAIDTNQPPDLVALDIAVNPRFVDQESTITAVIQNNGGQSASNFVYALSIDSSVVKTGTVTTLSAMQTASVQYSYTETGTGYHTVKLDVDGSSNVVESSETNNVLQKSFLWTEEPLPDLIVQDIWTEPSLPTEGQSYVIKAQIRNIGDDITSGFFTTRFVVDGSTVGTDSSFSISPSSADEVQSGTLTAPEAGTHSIRVETDYNNSVDEEFENNNDRTEPFSVQPASLPDLVISSMGVSTPTYAWQPSTITAVVSNRGSSVAEFDGNVLFPEKICRFEVDGQAKNDITFITVTIPPGGTYTADTSVTVSSTGSFAVVALADPDGEITESLENNNSLTVSNVWTVSPTADSDGDGMKDADEVIAGSDPGAFSNVWKCAAVAVTNGYALRWPSISNRLYDVERTFTLTNGFVAIATNLMATPPENTYLDSETGTNAFYRINVRE